MPSSFDRLQEVNAKIDALRGRDHFVLGQISETDRLVQERRQIQQEREATYWRPSDPSPIDPSRELWDHP